MLRKEHKLSGNYICYRPQVKGGETLTEGAILNHYLAAGP